jgi:hypothetical protein
MTFRLASTLSDRIMFYNYLQFQGTTNGTGMVYSVECSAGEVQWNSDSFTVTLRNWYKGLPIDVAVYLQSLITYPPTQVRISWSISGDATSSGSSNIYTVDPPVRPTISSTSLVSYHRSYQENLTQNSQVLLNRTSNTLQFTVKPSKPTYEYYIDITVNSPNGAVSFIPGSVSPSAGRLCCNKWR